MKAKLIKNKDSYYLTIDKETYQEVIAHSFDGGKKRLSLKNCQAIERGYDLDELAKRHHKLAYIQAYNPDIAPYVEADYKAGFQKALELMGDRKFTEQDMYKMFDYARSIDTAKKHIKKLEDKPIGEFFNDFIQSLQQNEWDIEIVTFTEDDLKSVSEDWGKLGKPKLDADGCLILKRK